MHSAETVEQLLNNMFDVDNGTDNVILCGISYLLMLIDTKRYAMYMCVYMYICMYVFM